MRKAPPWLKKFKHKYSKLKQQQATGYSSAGCFCSFKGGIWRSPRLAKSVLLSAVGCFQQTISIMQECEPHWNSNVNNIFNLVLQLYTECRINSKYGNPKSCWQEQRKDWILCMRTQLHSSWLGFPCGSSVRFLLHRQVLQTLVVTEPFTENV